MCSGNGNICIRSVTRNAAVAVTIMVSSLAYFQQNLGCDKFEGNRLDCAELSMKFHKTPRVSSALQLHQPTNLTIYPLPLSEYQRCLIPTPSILTLTITCGITIIFPMSGLKYWPGYRRLSLDYTTRTFKITESKI